MTVKYLLANIDSRELSEWWAFYAVRDEYRDRERVEVPTAPTGGRRELTPNEVSAKIMRTFRQAGY
jgi:hypothetical protein